MSQRRTQRPGNPRGPKPSQMQKDALGAFLEEHPELARGRTQGPDAARRASLLWRDIAVRLNASGGAMKDWKGWRKYWNDKKGHLKKMAGTRRAHATGTGGGPPLPQTPLTEWDERMLTLMGDGFGEGDPEVAVDIFPQERPRSGTPHQNEELSPVHEVVDVNVVVHMGEPGVGEAAQPVLERRHNIDDYDLIENAADSPAPHGPDVLDEPDTPPAAAPRGNAQRPPRRVAQTAYAEIHNLIVEKEQVRTEDARLGRELQVVQINLTTQQMAVMEEQNQLLRLLLGVLERFHGQ